MMTMRWTLLATVVTITSVVVLNVGFDLDSHVAAYISTGIAMALIVGRRVVVTRREIRERAAQFERPGSVEWDE
ncbi:hypothetical protein C7C46_27010 [Streptomyces tateyamensis]|uniref:Uncharacterized protein n=1 Tax=Streptomyces tateyamensis TaxID=565073 RepID=A0A2V4MVF2_9ACTN|nr:hypothetical protein [Streptomyces tateyamensis]PYC70994.1 hypothetical protein C7C46_27010 [Streptomyces tateyamensis]